MRPRHEGQAGLSLLEVIVFILVVSVALAGVMSVFNVVGRGNADPVVRKQMIAVAEFLLEEVQAQPFPWCDPDDPAVWTASSAAGCTVPDALGPEAGEVRGAAVGGYDSVSDYVKADGTAISGTAYGLGDATTAISNAAGSAAAPVGYTAQIQVSPLVLNGSGAAAWPSDVLLISVSVAYRGDSVTLHGVRSRYAPNAAR